MRVVTAILVLIGSAGVTGPSPAASDQPVPVLVELFTAEGCSTCPPADRLLEAMITSQPASGVLIVGLGEHVDYWDRLGWKDRFSSAAFTRRQQLYADRLESDNVYTPQMIVDGQTAFVGSDVGAARRAIERASAAPHGTVRIDLDTPVTNRVAITVTATELPRSDDRSDVIVALVEDGLRTDVKRGENKGQTLTHAAVVREMVTAGEAAAGRTVVRTEVTIARDWKRDRMRAVAFVQERKSRRILATASVPLA
ncbi:MAG TPA: DUF1223 domain-containing protein [Vicinamibacterales bacterium]|nr:DUF1223 domain-containing protein [Vicinamibacterales bacterium]